MEVYLLLKFFKFLARTLWTNRRNLTWRGAKRRNEAQLFKICGENYTQLRLQSEIKREYIQSII
jgi:hypothetical protein